jgi:hypothetical protein
MKPPTSGQRYHWYRPPPVSSVIDTAHLWSVVLLPLTNGQCTNARVTQLRVLQRIFMSTHININARLGYGFGKATARLYQCLLTSTLACINYQHNYVVLISVAEPKRQGAASFWQCQSRRWSCITMRLRLQLQLFGQGHSMHSFQHIHYDVDLILG